MLMQMKGKKNRFVQITKLSRIIIPIEIDGRQMAGVTTNTKKNQHLNQSSLTQLCYHFCSFKRHTPSGSCTPILIRSNMQRTNYHFARNGESCNSLVTLYREKRTPSDNNALLAMRQKNGTIFKKFSESFPPHWTQRNGASDEFSLNDNGLIKWFYEHGLDQAAHPFSVDAILVLFVLYFGRF